MNRINLIIQKEPVFQIKTIEILPEKTDEYKNVARPAQVVSNDTLSPYLT